MAQKPTDPIGTPGFCQFLHDAIHEDEFVDFARIFPTYRGGQIDALYVVMKDGAEFLVEVRRIGPEVYHRAKLSHQEHENIRIMRSNGV